MMNLFEKHRKDCQLGIKALQNLRAASSALHRLQELSESGDFLLLSSLFHYAIVKYAKPFLGCRIGEQEIRYPVKRLRKENGFSEVLHEHLILVRNTLVAHDDFNHVSPRILTMCICPQDTNFQIPVSITIANKSISHPADKAGVDLMFKHVMAAFEVVGKNLSADMVALREITLKQPHLAKDSEQYSKHYGTQQVSGEGTRIVPPDVSGDPWLNPDEPDFSSLHKGFLYEPMSAKKEFHGPEMIELPNGERVEINP